MAAEKRQDERTKEKVEQKGQTAAYPVALSLFAGATHSAKWN